MSDLHETDRRPPPHLTLVTSPGCHFCDDALQALSPFAAERLIELAIVDAGSPDGGELVRLHRPALFPLVLVDGEFFSAGRLPRRKLADVLGVGRVAV